MDRYTEINNLITYIASKTKGITTEQIQKAREKYSEDKRDVSEIEKELWDLSAQITEEYDNKPQPKDDVTPEEMVENITGTLERKEVKDAIKSIWDETHSINMLSNIVGEVYLYHIIHRDGYNFDDYLNKLLSIYSKRLNKEEFSKAKTNLLLESIKSRLHITNNEMTPEEDKKVQDYFLNTYVENGYVVHSFHGEFLDSINKNGLSPEPTERIWDSEEINNIANILSSHGAEFAIGGYNHYDGKGIYYDHNMNNMYKHSFHSPEWFTVFTSSDHLMNLGDISKNPYILRDYKACRRNVEDLADNTNLSSEERKEVLRFFEKTFYQLSNPDSYVALIPKKVVGKNIIHKESNAFDTIHSTLNDTYQDFKEHVNNSAMKKIPKQEIIINKLPRIKSFIDDKDNKIEYTRETKEELFNQERIEQMKQHVEKVNMEIKEKKGQEAVQRIDRIGDDTTVPRDVRIARLKSIRSKVVEKSSKNNDMNKMFYTKPTNNQQVKENVSTQQKVMVKANNSSNNSSGYANSLLIIAISLMTLVTSVLLYLAK